MNAGLTTSFIIGGLLLLSILQMNFTVSTNASQTTLQIVSKNRMQAITSTLTSDFERMGFNVANIDTAITSMSDSKISFWADIDGTTRIITWDFKDSNSYASTANPNDHKLVRTGSVSSGNVQDIVYPAVHFELTYFDEDGNSTATPAQVRNIRVELLTESPEAIRQNKSSNENIYGRSFWQKTIIPPSLQF